LFLRIELIHRTHWLLKTEMVYTVALS